MTKPTIERGIPIPPPATSRNRPSPVVDAIEMLSIAESVLIRQPITSVTSAINRASARTGRKFTARTVEGGTRIWRIV